MFSLSAKLDAVLRDVGAMLLTLNADACRGVWEGDQLKTEADRLAHLMLAEGLDAIGLGVPVISEEGENFGAGIRPDRYWLIDPLDGTRSFVDGFPGYVTQAAYFENGNPVVAGVFAPKFNDLFSAIRGGGAQLNGRPLKIFPRQSISTLIDNYPEPRGISQHAFNAFGLKKYLESGSIGLKICRIADQTADITLKDVTVRDWDIAPADLILREAGGDLRLINGLPFPYQGSFEKLGFIAGASETVVSRFSSWLNAR